MRAFRQIFRRPPRSADDVRRAVDEELAFHLEGMEEDLRQAGMDPGEAREEALRRFGDVEATRAYCVGQQERRTTRRGWTMRIDELRQDVGYALRTLRRSPGYALVVALTLAVGISASTVVFSLVNPYFLRPLPYGDPDGLVQLGLVDPRYEWDGARFSLAMLEDYRGRSTSLAEVATYYYGTTNVTGPEGPERLQIGYLSDNMFRVLRADAEIGRTFAEGEAGPGGAPVVVVDRGLWQ
ncbi:MAG TPA: permease prefix domain 1-containing protein, partial [Longimicrobiales bacterium]|nr:permease prefix domain 1-containing protein [Longimicrobiales bacterium]